MATIDDRTRLQGGPITQIELELSNLDVTGDQGPNVPTTGQTPLITTNNYSQAPSGTPSGSNGNGNAVVSADARDEGIGASGGMENSTNGVGIATDRPIALKKTYWKIIGLAGLASVPLIVLISVFLGLVQNYTVHRTAKHDLVRFQPTRLTMPLQIAALIAPFTLGILMKIWAFHIGRKYVEEGGFNRMAQQHPSQHAILIEYLFFPGGLTMLKAILYVMIPLRNGRFGGGKIARILPKGGRSELIQLLREVILVLALGAFFCFGLALLTTVTSGVVEVINYEQVSKAQGELELFGRELPPACNETNTTNIGGVPVPHSCSVKGGLDGWVQAKSGETVKVLSNESTANSILWDNQNMIAFLAPPEVSRFIDFEATTIGLHSTCVAKGNACQLNANMDPKIANQRCNVTGFRDFENETQNLSLSQGVARTILFDGPGVANPFHYWLWANVEIDNDSGLRNETEFLDLGIAISVLLDCEVSIVNYTFSFTNGTLDSKALALNESRTSNSVAYVFIDPLQLSFGMREIYQRLRADVASLPSAVAIANATARSMSQTALAFAAGMFVQTTAAKQSTREDILVTQIPIALVSLCSLFAFAIAMMGLALALIAVLDVRSVPKIVTEIEEMRLKALVRLHS